MKKKFGLLLATAVVMNVFCAASFASTSPLEKYNLYDDVMGGSTPSSANQDRERATSDFYNNSMRPGSDGADGKMTEEQKQEAELAKKNQSLDTVLNSVNKGEMIGPRNKALRESSRRVFSDLKNPDPWKSEISFYPNPSINGIREKYRRSNFAGALQESISLVNHRNFSSLTNEQKTMAYYYLAMSYTKCGQKDNAVRAYEKVISLNDCPMIVKYATNGRNCVMGKTDTDACYPNVNVPELVYPNAHIADSISPSDLVPIDPNTLINKNMKKLQNSIVPEIQNATNGKDGEKPLNLPFGTQDAELDKFINAPYGNGLSPKFNNEYKQIQLRTLQKKMNAEAEEESKSGKPTGKAAPVDLSSLETVNLAYDANSSSEMEKLEKDPEYIRQKQEIEELNKLFGSKSNGEGDITDLLPYVTEQGDKKLSPEVIQALMMQSVMSDLTL